MIGKMIGVGFALVLLGCVGDDADPAGGGDVSVPGKPMPATQDVCPECGDAGDELDVPTRVPGVIALQNRITATPVDVETDIGFDPTCSLLPATGPCSAACDLAVLETYIPQGTCVSFYCVLTDGRTMLAGGCNP